MNPFPDNYKVLIQNEVSWGNYRLVPIRYEDRTLIMKWRNEQIYHLRQIRPLTEVDQENYFNSVVRSLFDQEKPTQILFSFLKNNVCIGYGGLVHINWEDRHAEISFIMNTELEKTQFDLNWSVYLRLIQKIAFGDLKLHKIFTYAFDLRPHLYNVLEAGMFTREATLKEHCYFNGTYKDVVIHTLINKNVSVRKLTIEDAEITWLWANDQQTRSQSFNSEPILIGNHTNWLQNKLTDPNALYLMIEANQIPCGIVRFDKDLETGNFMIGINIAPEFRGQSLAAVCLRLACSELFEKQDGTVDAYIKEQNYTSVRSFEKAGFKLKGKTLIQNIPSYHYQLTSYE